jgi:anti-sigma B factor antagonist
MPLSSPRWRPAASYAGPTVTLRSGTPFALIASAMVGKNRDHVSIQGRVTIDTSGEMRRTIADALRPMPPAVTLDLSGVTYIDTSGLATLLEASRIARLQGTRLVLHGLHSQPRDLLHFSQIDHLLDIAEWEPDGQGARR